MIENMKNEIEIAFALELLRQKFAENNNHNKLKNLYSPNLPEIMDKNSPNFWDKIFTGQKKLSEQDGMTRDRVKIAAKFCPSGKVKVLDIGAGLGFLEELLSKNNLIELYGNDFSSVSVDRLKRLFEGNFKKESIYNMKYPNNFFDVVYALEVLEHIPPSKIFSVIKKVNKLLKQDGAFIISVPMNEGLEEMYPVNPNSHLRMYTEALIKAELEMNGFKVVQQETFFAFEDYYFFKKVYSKLHRNKWAPNNIVLKAVKI